MTLSELENLFSEQLKQGPKKVSFALFTDSVADVKFHDANDIAGIIPLIEGYRYTGLYANIPKFTK